MTSMNGDEDREKHMKIAFIVGYFPECSSFIVNQITGLIRLGHQVEIFAVKERHGKTTLPDVDTFQLLQHAHFFSIPEGKLRRVWNALVIISRQPRRFQYQLLAALNVFKFGLDALKLNVFYITIPFLGQSFDVLHAHFGPNGLLGAALKKMGIPGKLITSFYGYDLSSFVRKKGPLVYRELFKVSDRLLPICAYLGNKLRQLGCPEAKILVHHLGIDLSRFALSQAQHIPQENWILLTVAHLFERKGLDISIQAFARIRHAFQGLHYVIAGDGPLETELKELARMLKIDHRVRFIGTVSQDEEIEWLKRAQVFILTSRTASDGDEEGTPTVLLEAQAVGVPVISTLHSGIPEVIENEKTGFVVPEGDISAVAERLIELLQNKQLRKRMGENGRVLIERKFAARTQSEKLVAIYIQSLQPEILN